MRGRLNTYRFYCLAGGIMVLGLRIIIAKEDPFDPMWLRATVAASFWAVMIASFVSDWVALRITQLFGSCITLLGAWLALMLWGNDFHQDYMSGYNVLTVASVLLFDVRRYMATFTAIAAGTLVAAALLCHNPPSEMWPFIGVSLAIYGIGNFIVTMRVNTRTKMEIELSRSLVIQEAAIESNADAILLVDSDGNYLKANSAFLKMWGIPQQHIDDNNQQESEQIALSLAKDPETLRAIMTMSDAGAAAGSRRQLEFIDGRVIDMYWLPMNTGDELIGRLWYFRDATAQWLNEKALLNTEKQLRRQNEMLMEFAASFAANAGNIEEAFREITSVSTELLAVDTVGIWFFDRVKGTMHLKLQYRRQTKDFSHGVDVRVADHPDYFAALFKSKVFAVNDTQQLQSTSDFREGKYSGSAASIIHSQITAGGECIGVLTFECADVVREWTMEEQNYAGSLADMISISLATEEKQLAQNRLHNSSAILQAIFDLSETGIIVEDNDHNILNYNELYLTIFNMTKEFIDTQPYKVLIQHCLGQLKNSHAYVEGLETLKVRPGMEYAGIMEFHDGRFVERYSKAINVGGEMKGRVWFYLDITDRKRKENELINRNFELDSFVYRASHDLKAPLNSIMGLISLIREESELSSIMQYIAMMDKSVLKLDDFIKQLTQFSQEVRLKIVCKPISFKEMVEDVLEVLKFMDNAARIQVTVDVTQTGTFYSDPVRLGIVVSNLVSNAIKYQDLRKEKAMLEIIIRADEQQAEFTFRDNGLGIREEHLERVFDLFFRASVQASGTGLGLYITHNAVQKLGGELSVASQLGVGTTFSLTLPSLKENAEQEQDADPAIDASPSHQH